MCSRDALRTHCSYCIAAESADTKQIDDTVKLFGKIAGVLGRVHAHAIRNGALRDLKSTKLPSTTTNVETVASYAGHSHNRPDVTRECIGGTRDDTWSVRLSNSNMPIAPAPAIPSEEVATNANPLLAHLSQGDIMTAMARMSEHANLIYADFRSLSLSKQGTIRYSAYKYSGQRVALTAPVVPLTSMRALMASVEASATNKIKLAVQKSDGLIWTGDRQETSEARKRKRSKKDNADKENEDSAEDT